MHCSSHAVGGQADIHTIDLRIYENVFRCFAVNETIISLTAGPTSGMNRNLHKTKIPESYNFVLESGLPDIRDLALQNATFWKLPQSSDHFLK